MRQACQVVDARVALDLAKVAGGALLVASPEVSRTWYSQSRARDWRINRLKDRISAYSEACRPPPGHHRPRCRISRHEDPDAGLAGDAVPPAVPARARYHVPYPSNLPGTGPALWRIERAAQRCLSSSEASLGRLAKHRSPERPLWLCYGLAAIGPMAHKMRSVNT
jgi:hypothetical protein